MSMSDYARVVRVRQIAQILRRGEPWNALTVAEKMGVTSRTIKRDIEFLRSLGYQIEWKVSEGTYTLIHRPRAIL